MKRPEQHEIDEQACRIFKNAVPPAWVVRRQDPDYGIDYHVEVTELERLTGLMYGVQLKGTKNLRVGKGFISFPVETVHLAYYRDKCRYPVFLVVVDVTCGCGYWHFLQGHDLGSKNWRSQRTVSIRIPASQTLDKLDNFRNEVARAEGVMASLRPGSIRTSLAAEKARMESLDPRFEVAITATGSHTHYELNPREPVKVEFSIKRPDKDAKLILSDLFGRGVPVSLGRGEIEVAGAPIIEEACTSSNGVTLHLAQRTPCEVSFRCIDDAGLEVLRVGSLHGAFEGGMTEQRLHAELPESPFQLGLTVTSGVDRKISMGPVQFRMVYGPWFGRRILNLPYFQMLHSFFNEMARGRQLELEIMSRGIRVCRGRTAPTPNPFWSNRLLELLARARCVAEVFCVNPILPADLSEDDIDGVNLIHDIASGTRRSGKGVSVTTPVDDARLVKAALEQQPDAPGQLVLKKEDGVYTLFKENIALGAHTYFLSHAQLVNRKEVERQIAQGERICLEWTGTDESEFWVERDSGKPSF